MRKNQVLSLFQQNQTVINCWLIHPCPMIETAEQTREFVATCRYPSKGNRSFGPSRAMIYAGSDYPEKAEETILPMVMIETRQALDNLDDILSTEGLGAIYIGPFDLSCALGCQPQPDHYEPPVMEAIEHILACSKKHKVPAAIHCMGPQFADRMRKKGFSLVTAGSDADFVRSGATHTIKALRQ